jgi:hypothetical protein
MDNKKRNSLRPLIMTALLACAAWTTPVVAAEGDGGLLEDSWVLSLGTFLVSTETELGLNGSGGQAGTVVDLEKDLGVDDSDRLRFDAAWRFKKRHRIRLLYFSTDNSGSRQISRQITVGDTTYPVNARIDTNVETTITELAYEYAFLRRPTYEVAATAGVHGVKFDFRVSGTGSVGGRPPASGQTETAVTEAPLPVFGLRGLWEFSPKWYLDGHFQYFTLSYDAYDGSITDLNVSVTRMFGKHWGLGAGWNQFSTDVDVEKDRFNGSLDWTYSGFKIFVTAAF